MREHSSVKFRPFPVSVVLVLHHTLRVPSWPTWPLLVHSFYTSR